MSVPLPAQSLSFCSISDIIAHESTPKGSGVLPEAPSLFPMRYNEVDLKLPVSWLKRHNPEASLRRR